MTAATLALGALLGFVLGLAVTVWDRRKAQRVRDAADAELAALRVLAEELREAIATVPRQVIHHHRLDADSGWLDRLMREIEDQHRRDEPWRNYDD